MSAQTCVDEGFADGVYGGEIRAAACAGAGMLTRATPESIRELCARWDRAHAKAAEDPEEEPDEEPEEDPDEETEPAEEEPEKDPEKDPEKTENALRAEIARRAEISARARIAAMAAARTRE